MTSSNFSKYQKLKLHHNKNINIKINLKDNQQSLLIKFNVHKKKFTTNKFKKLIKIKSKKLIRIKLKKIKKKIKLI